MNEYVITIGNSGLQTWWQVAVVAVFAGIYIMMNIIPAAVYLFTSVAQKEFGIETPLIVLFLLVPFIGSLVGLMSYQGNKWAFRILLVLLYALIISGIAGLIEMY